MGGSGLGIRGSFVVVRPDDEGPRATRGDGMHRARTLDGLADVAEVFGHRVEACVVGGRDSAGVSGGHVRRVEGKFPLLKKRGVICCDVEPGTRRRSMTRGTADMISPGNGRGRTCCCVVSCRSMPRAISKCRTARVSLTNRTNELDCRGDEDDSTGADPIHRRPNLICNHGNKHAWLIVINDSYFVTKNAFGYYDYIRRSKGKLTPKARKIKQF